MKVNSSFLKLHNKTAHKLVLFLFFLLLVSVYTACKKSGTTAFDLSTSQTPSIYPSKITYSTNLINAYNNYGLGPVTFYTYTYNPSLKLITLNIRYGNNTADSIYNKITYDASGRIQQLGTNNNNNATIISYSTTGDISSITQTYLLNGKLTNDIRNFQYSAGQIIQSNKFIAQAATPSVNNTFVSDANGNIINATLINGTSTNQVTLSYYGSNYPNPFYGLAKNKLFAFLPEQLWANIEFILFSKNLLKTIDLPGQPTQTFTYQFDALNRIVAVTNTITVLNGNPYILTYTITYAN